MGDCCGTVMLFAVLNVISWTGEAVHLCKLIIQYTHAVECTRRCQYNQIGRLWLSHLLGSTIVDRPSRRRPNCAQKNRGFIDTVTHLKYWLASSWHNCAFGTGASTASRYAHSCNKGVVQIQNCKKQPTCTAVGCVNRPWMIVYSSMPTCSHRPWHVKNVAVTIVTFINRLLS